MKKIVDTEELEKRLAFRICTLARRVGLNPKAPFWVTAIYRDFIEQIKSFPDAEVSKK